MSLIPNKGDVGPYFRFTSLTRGDRQNIINIAGNQLPGSAFAQAKEFTLSSLGTTMDVRGEWKKRNAAPGVPPNGLLSWRHLTTSGRDQHVKTVYLGYLFPFGHQATLITITDRVLTPDPASPSEYADAYLQFRSFIRVTQRTKSYPAPGQPYKTAAWPFSSVEMLTHVTPNLDPAVVGVDSNYPDFPPGLSGDYPQAFFPKVGGESFAFKAHLIDEAGTIVPVHVPLVFFFAESGTSHPLNEYDMSPLAFTKLINEYNALGQQASPSSDVTTIVPGTHVRFAPEVTLNGKDKPGVTTHPTLSMTFGVATPVQVPSVVANPNPSTDPDHYIAPIASPISVQSLTSAAQPAFYPTLMSANVRLPAAETLSRGHLNDPGGPGGVALFLYGPYISKGFTTPKLAHGASPRVIRGRVDPTGSSNPGSVYAGLLNQPGLKFPSDMVGGLGNPNLGVSGLSAAAGAIGGQLGQYADNAPAKATDYFGGLLDAKFLGGLKLSDILGDLLGQMDAPEILREVNPDGTITVTYTLSIDLRDDPTGVFKPASGGTFKLTATVVVSLTGTATMTVKGVVDPFTISILGGAPIIEIPFGDSTTGQVGATFTAGTGKKADVKVNVGSPSFEGALAFVNTLEDFLKDIGGSGVSINVGPTQISASVSLALPSVGVGVFNLEHMALSASVVIPFLGGATIATFAFCSQEKPFSLTVMCFGGGGYVLVGVGLTDLESLTASLDFEGQLALDLGVASGGVSAMAGITFSYVKGPGPDAGASLTGFVKLTGEVEVLGIISVTIELDLSLKYNISAHSATGTATMKISVSVCFFSISVPITVQKTFNGGNNSHLAHAVEGRVHGHTDPYPTNNDLTFGAQMSVASWSDYCAAFAA